MWSSKLSLKNRISRVWSNARPKRRGSHELCLLSTRLIVGFLETWSLRSIKIESCCFWTVDCCWCCVTTRTENKCVCVREGGSEGGSEWVGEWVSECAGLVCWSVFDLLRSQFMGSELHTSNGGYRGWSRSLFLLLLIDWRRSRMVYETSVWSKVCIDVYYVDYKD
jgi:hypothetical protein